MFKRLLLISTYMVITLLITLCVTTKKDILTVNAQTDSNSWRYAYEQYLRDEVESIESIRFALAYIDSDNIPELIVGYENAHPDSISVLSYKNGNLIDYKNKSDANNFGESGTLYYYEKENIIDDIYSGMGDYCNYIYSIDDSEATLEVSFRERYEGNEDGTTYSLTYYINEREVDKDTYDVKSRPYQITHNQDTLKCISYGKSMLDVTDDNLREMLYYPTDTVIAEGTCGKNVTWKYILTQPEIVTLDDTTTDTTVYNTYFKKKGQLIISGSGDMDDYADGQDTPWDIAIGEYMESVAEANGTFYDLPDATDTDIIIEDGVTHLGSYSFSNNEWMSPMSIQLPNTLKSIGERVFSARSYNGAYLEEVYIPSSVISIDPTAFSCSVESFNVDKDNPYYTSVDGVLFNKDMSTLVIYPSMKSLICYRVPSSVKTIYSTSFCAYQTYVNEHPDIYRKVAITFPNDVNVIEVESMYDNDEEYSIDYPFQSIRGTQDSSPYYYGVSVYVPSVYSNIAKFIEEIDSTNISIITNDVIIDGTCGKDITWKEYKDGTLVVEGTGEIIADNFKDSDGNSISFAYAEIGNTTTSTGQYGVEVTHIVIGDGITSIGDSAFSVSWTYSIELPDTLQEIGQKALHCSNIETFYVSGNLTSLDEAFIYGNGFKQFVVDDNNPNYTSVDGVLYSKDMSELIAYPAYKPLNGFVVPSSVKTIKKGAFDFTYTIDPSELQQDVVITIPSTVSTIEDNGLYPFCSIKSAYDVTGCYNSFTVIAERGSVVEEYISKINEYSGLDEINTFDNHKQYNYVAFESIDVSNTGTKYDINNDSMVNMIDVLLLKKSILGVSNSSCYRVDFNNDNVTNILDLIELKRYIL